MVRFAQGRVAEALLHQIFKTLLSWGPIGVVLLAAIDSAGVPLPEGVDLLLVSVSVLNPSGAYLAATLAVIGSVAGNMVLFYAARKGGQAYLERKASSERAIKLRRWFKRYGLLTVFIPALVPIPLPTKVFVLCAGALGVSPASFGITILVARIPRYYGMAWLGAQVGEHSLDYLRDHMWELCAFAAALFAFLYLLIKLRDRLHPAAPEAG
jgi:membrane protein YqaA with SNARE-associated domain